jgi:hypothetical protein
MILISHRGNLSGVDKKNENRPDYIINALEQGFDVEIDVRMFKNKLYLGHDEPQHEISNNFVENKKLWCHAKELASLELLSQLKCIYFWHQQDDYTITSNGYFWTYPGIKVIKKSICVLPEKTNYVDLNCAGICSDYIKRYKKKA